MYNIDFLLGKNGGKFWFGGDTAYCDVFHQGLFYKNFFPSPSTQFDVAVVLKPFDNILAKFIAGTLDPTRNKLKSDKLLQPKLVFWGQIRNVSNQSNTCLFFQSIDIGEKRVL